MSLGEKNTHIKFVLVHSFVRRFIGSGCSAPQVIPRRARRLLPQRRDAVGGGADTCPGRSLAGRISSVKRLRSPCLANGRHFKLQNKTPAHQNNSSSLFTANTSEQLKEGASWGRHSRSSHLAPAVCFQHQSHSVFPRLSFFSTF